MKVRNLKPEAHIIAPESVNVRSIVEIEGENVGTDTDVLHYHWSLQTPANLNSKVKLGYLNPNKPIFIPDVPGIYTVKLELRDGKEQSSTTKIIEVK